ncbi:deoxynucleoside triphosphate triphosphohydrolase SAMHD1-like isoform X2 [Mercenaria mercenaria]|uniref:deoxynucleoside triphosphate triphosphohydrolase SAMHD1-like isoform X2 n=1 Tax=Mercenaria mercenaria TaxID=6596 RepID=UPI00234F8D8B|nr:deoxynucleoside triphosphate triphosphohydrolase SAMHD1-like isoform X2 [Mercenaria mercenaria]
MKKGQQNMPTHKPVKYSHLITVLHRCGRRITKELFLKRVQDLTPEGHEPFPWTVDQFLEANRETILKCRQGKDLKRKLFPGYARQTNVDYWDLTTFCFLLFNVCDLRPAVRQDINCLRQLRNKLVHLGGGDVTDQKYQTYLDTMKGVLNRCTNELDKPELMAELENVIAESMQTVQVADVEEDEEELKQWYMEEQKFHVGIEIAQDGQDIDEVKATLLNFQMKFEENEMSTKMDLSFTIGIRVIGMNRQAEEVLSAAQQCSASGKVPFERSSARTISIGIERIKEDVRQMGPDVESDSKGSVMFKFTCFSVTSLIYLVDYFTGATMQRRVQDITKAIEDMVDDMVALQIYIPPTIYQEVIKKLEKIYTSDEACRLQFKQQIRNRKVFNDPIYGQIELHPLCVKIIDTPQFQRLRYIKQLETVYLVYPGASHNRFEHSIGVCHLAGKLLRVLKERQPELDITTKDILCVEIAALCHDLGQGPFSHVFEHKFIPAVIPDTEWKHEKASVKMFDYMLRDNDGKLHEYVRQMIPGFEERDIEFIRELIYVPFDLNAEVWPCRGRNKNKSFLYEVVANRVNGIDVDRWDYIARDSLMLGMKTTFEHNRLIQHARVLMAEGRRQICYRDKAAQDLYDMFYARMTLYRRAYQHKTHNIIGMMIRDALIAANDDISFHGENGNRLRMSDTIHDMKAYTHLTDDILQKIQRSSKRGLEKSRAIINRILYREFYKCITQTQVDVKQKGWIKRTAVQENLFNKIKQKRTDLTDLSEIVEIDVVNLDYGSKDKDPVTKVWFFKKGQEDTAIRINKEQVSFVLPDTFAEQYVRVYSSVTDSRLFDIIEQSFSEWCKENDIPQPKGLSIHQGKSPV